MRIVLVGGQGVGKTTIGQQIAKKISKPFFNQDDLLHTNLQFPHNKRYTHQQYQEKKRLENLLLSQILSQQNEFVFSCGAGFLNGEDDDEELIQRVQSTTTLVCLKKNNDNLREKFCRVSVDVEGKTPEEVVLEVLNKIN